MVLRAIVKDGPLVLDEPTDLPDGTVLALVADAESGELEPDDLARLNASLMRSAAAIDAAQDVDGDELIARLRATSS